MIRIAAAGVLAALCYMTLMPVVGNLRMLPDVNGGPKVAVHRSPKGATEKKAQDFSDPEDLFTVRFPVEPTLNRQRYGSLGTLQREYNARLNGVTYSVEVNDLGYDLSEESAFNLKWILERFVGRAGVKTNKSRLFREGDHVVGAEVGGRWDGNSARVWRCRLYIVRQYAVVVEVVGPTDDFDAAEAAAFFDSSQLSDKALVMPPYRPQRRRVAADRD